MTCWPCCCLLRLLLRQDTQGGYSGLPWFLSRLLVVDILAGRPTGCKLAEVVGSSASDMNQAVGSGRRRSAVVHSSEAAAF